MMLALEKYEATTGYEAQDLATAEYKRDSEFGSLEWVTGDRYELNEWSARQLCRLTLVPFGIWRKASENLSRDMFKEFAPAMKDSQVKLAYKTFGKNKKVLRGLLKVDYPDIRNSEVLRSLQDISTPFDVEYAGWMDEAHPALLRTRVVIPSLSKTINNEDLKIGIDITCSELGASPLQVNILIYRPICKNGVIVAYGHQPYFFFDYSSTFIFDLKDVIDVAVVRVSQDVNEIMMQVEIAVATPYTLDQARLHLSAMVKEGILNKGVVNKTLATLEKEGCSRLWDMINTLTAQARGFRDGLRLKYERAAGLMMGLELTRQKGEDEYATTAPVTELPSHFLSFESLRLKA